MVSRTLLAVTGTHAPSSSSNRLNAIDHLWMSLACIQLFSTNMQVWIVARSPCSVPSIFMLKKELRTRSAENFGASAGRFWISSILTRINDRTLVNLPSIEAIGTGLLTILAHANSAVSHTS